MSDHKDTQLEKKRRVEAERKRAPAAQSPDLVAEALPDPSLAFKGGTVESQVETLQHLSPAQRRAMLLHISRMQGNVHAQRLLSAMRQSEGVDSSSEAQTAGPTPQAEIRPIRVTAPKLSAKPALPLAVQAKLTVSQPEDQYEQEAERVASEVMRMPPAPATPPPPDEGDKGDGKVLAIKRAASHLETRGDGQLQASAEAEARIQRMRGGGHPLPDGERAFFEERMGVDLGGVRLHTNDQAAQTSQDLQAQAFTVGSDIMFGQGKYQPGTQDGRRLMAHELTHVVQQGGAQRLKRAPNGKIHRSANTDGPIEGGEEEGPTEAEIAAAMAAAAVAESAAATAHAEGKSEESDSLAESANERKAGQAPQQEAAASQAQGPVQAAAEQARQATVAESAQAAQSQGAEAQAAAQQQAQTAAEKATQAEPPAEAAAQLAAQASQPQAAGGGGGDASGGPGGGGGLEGATVAAQAAVQQAFAQAESAPDKAPTASEEDPAFQSTQESVQAAGQEQQTHEPAQGEADAAQAAVESPASEIESQAQANQVGQMEQAETPGFDAAAFKAKLMERIAALAPKTAEQADEFKESGAMNGVKSDLQGQVDKERTASQDPLQQATEAAPDTSSVTPKEVTPLEAPDPGAAPSDIGAAQAMPKPKGQGEVEAPVQEGDKALDQQMADAEITEEQLSKSNEPQFTAALDAKNEAQTQAQESPAEYRQAEQTQISSAEAEAVAAAQEQLQGMHDSRVEALNQVAGQQTQAKSDDEAAREKVATDIQNIYTETKTKVEEILNGLDGEVDEAFNAGAQTAKQTFEDFVDRKMEAYKERRYGGWLGWAKWLKDKFCGMPSEVNGIYDQGRQLYIGEMDAVIDKVVSMIGTRLSEAKAEIARGKQRIQEYVDKLPEDLKQVGQQAAQDIQSQFDQLEQSVDSKQDQLIDTLANKYQENLQAIDARIEEMKAANRGLIDQAIEAMGGVIKTIIELKNMLMGILSRAVDAIKAILQDPIGFVGNLISAVKQGLQNFVSNIGTHLKAGFIEWLTGTLSGAGITLPETWDIKGIFSLVLQILGLTWQNIRSRAAAIFGETVVKALETGFEIFVIVRDHGLPGLWEWVKDKLTTLKDQVIDGIKDMLITEVVKAGIQWLLSMLGGPAGAFIKAAKMIYDVVMWFINNAQRILALVNAIIDSVTAIAAGNLAGAAQFVENALAKMVPIAIGFLAGLIGLGDLSNKVRTIIQKIQAPINNAIDAVLNLVKGFVSKIAKLLGFGGGGGKEGGQVGKEVTFSAAEESHTLSVTKQGELTLDNTALSGKLNEMGTKIGAMKGEEKGEAQGLLSQAQGKESNASVKAASLAQKMQAVKKLGDEDSLAADQQALEADEDALAGTLTQLFEKAESGGGAEVKAKVRDELTSQLGGKFESYEQAQAVISAVFRKYQPEGLKSLDIELGPDGKFDILAEASPVSVIIGNIEYKFDSTETQTFIDLSIQLNPAVARTSLFADVNGEKINPYPIQNERGERHAEHVFVEDYLPAIRERAQQHFEATGKRTDLSITLNHSPCGDCATLLAAQQNSSNDYLQFSVSLAGPYANWEEFSKDGGALKLNPDAHKRIVEEIAILLEAGINVSATKVWEFFRDNHPSWKVRKMYGPENVFKEELITQLIGEAQTLADEREAEKEQIDTLHQE